MTKRISDNFSWATDTVLRQIQAKALRDAAIGLSLQSAFPARILEVDWLRARADAIENGADHAE